MIVGSSSKINNQNVSKEEMVSIDNLTKDSIMILPADKGQVTVMNKKENEDKCQQLPGDKKYKKLQGNPTRKCKGELVSILKDLKERKVITWELHKKLYPTIEQTIRFYSLPKVHKTNTPLVPLHMPIQNIWLTSCHH